MTTVIKTAATSQQVHEPTRELTMDEFAQVSATVGPCCAPTR
jgi:hypothetical protein